MEGDEDGWGGDNENEEGMDTRCGQRQIWMGTELGGGKWGDS